MKISNTGNIDNILRGLYYVTPAFMILDYVFDFNIRISFLSNIPKLKFIYYVICGLFAVFIYKFQSYTYYIAFLENILNLAINIIGFIYPYINYTDILLKHGTEDLKFYDLQSIINFIISGTILIICFNILQIKISTEKRGIN